MIEFQKHLDQKGFKYTYERRKIYEEVQRTESHFDADQLHEKFKKRGERISRDTVYRTLPLLLEAGVVQKSVGPGKREYFEKLSAKGHHDHLICLDCGKIIEFKNQEIEVLQDKIYEQYRFKSSFHELRLYGQCPKCGQKGA